MTEKELKNDWMGRPDSHFAFTTLGELPVGSRFILLPAPGPNQKDGDGFRSAYQMFLVIQKGIIYRPDGVVYIKPHSKVRSDAELDDIYLPDDTKVIRV